VDSVRAASIFILAHEPALENAEIEVLLKLRVPADAERIHSSYLRQIRARPALRSRLALNDGAKRYQWELIEEKNVDALPWRIDLTDEKTLRCRAHHSITNGIGVLYWLEDWFGFYNNSESTHALPPTEQKRPSGAFLQIARFAAAVRWIARFLLNSGRNPGINTIDLSGGRAVSHPRKYQQIRRIFGAAATQQIVARAHAANTTVTELLLSAAAEQLFETRRDRNRVLFAIPADITAWTPTYQRDMPGNPTSSLLVQLHRGAAIPTESRRSLASAARGVPYYSARLMDAFCSNESALREKIAAAARRPFAKRGPFETVSFILSNLGKHPEFAHLNAACEWASFSMRTDAPVLIAATIGGSLALELTFDEDLYKTSEITSVFEGIVGKVERL